MFLQTTRLGKAIRAVSQSREVAQVCGIDVQRIHLLTFGLGSALAAAGGSLVAVMVAIQPEMGQVYTFKSFLVIVLGGAGNYPGALLGGLLLGLVEQLASLFLTTQVNEAVAYVLLVLVLLIRPTGLLKGRVVKRWFPVGLAVLAVALALYPAAGHRLRRAGDAPALHVDRARPVLEPDLGAHRLRVLRPRGLLRHRRLRLGHPDRRARAGRGRSRAWAAAWWRRCSRSLIGWPCLRLKGPYFAIAMLGLNEVLRVVVSYFEGLTGGGIGLSLPTLHASVRDLLRDGAGGGGGDRGRPTSS